MDDRKLNPEEENRTAADEAAEVQNAEPEQNASEGAKNVEPEQNASEGAEKAAPETESAAPEQTPEEKRAARKKKFWKETREWITSLAVALLVVLVVRSLLFTIIRVDGSSMYSTLEDNERLFVTVYDVRFGTVERGDIVICHYPNRGWTNFVKRVVAVPGDSVYRENGVTHVVYTVKTGNTTEVYDDALDPRGLYSLGGNSDYEPYVLGEDEYFVVGDNRYNSHDSRDWNDGDPSNDVGPITKKMIVGHVRSVIWPLNKIRSVE